MKKLFSVVMVAVFFVLAKPVHAQNLGFSLSPFTFITLIASASSNSDIRENLWFAFDVNFLGDNNKERSVGIFIESYCYGLRYQQRQYTKDDHAGFFYGLFVRAEYREMGWLYEEDGSLRVEYSYIGGSSSIMGEKFQSVGATAGCDVGFRLRGEVWGATFFVGAGLPLFYCFGSALPPEEDMVSFYFLNALLRVVEIGLKIDFYN